MTKYINVINELELPESFNEKCVAFLEAGAKEVNGRNFQEDLVCVVDNDVSTAVYIFDDHEYEVFRQDSGRLRKWFIIKDAETLID